MDIDGQEYDESYCLYEVNDQIFLVPSFVELVSFEERIISLMEFGNSLFTHKY